MYVYVRVQQGNHSEDNLPIKVVWDVCVPL